MFHQGEGNGKKKRRGVLLNSRTRKWGEGQREEGGDVLTRIRARGERRGANGPLLNLEKGGKREIF